MQLSAALYVVSSSRWEKFYKMSPRRTLSLPKLATSSHDQDAPEINMSSIRNRPSRLEVIPDRSTELLNIHVAPTVASPRSHSRWPSSGSSIATAPDSPANMAKPALGDLVEEPSEREEVVPQEPPEDFYLEPFCICKYYATSKILRAN